jgi:hypothetical protein
MSPLISLKKAAVKAVINHKGKSIKPLKWVVIESDDWGAIRTASKQSYTNLQNKGYPVQDCPYNSFDALESNADLEALFETLHSVKGADGNPAHITFNTVMTNPNFEAIKKSDFQEYQYEHFFETLKKYPQHDQVETLYRQGMKSACMTPQFHGREHVHVNHWMKALQHKEQDLLDAFDEKMYTVFNPSRKNSCKDFNLDAWAMHNAADEAFISKSIEEGLTLFENTFGFKSKSIISACFSMSQKAEEVLANLGVKHLQGAYLQERVVPNQQETEKVKHFMGQKNTYDQFFTIRNANFEPSSMPNYPWVESVLQDLYWAFFWGKPAIINAHRLNFIGYINEHNRTQNLKLLKALLIQIVKRWPEVCFVSSDRLSELYK